MEYKNRGEYSTALRSLEYFIYASLCFFVPFFTSQQIFTGTVVNCAIVLVSLRFKRMYSYPLIVLPSCAVLLSGFIFGSLTRYLVYMLPYIIVGNFLLSRMIYSNKNKFAGNIFGIIAKIAIIFIPALIMIKLTILPAAFLFLMGAMQIITAVSGSVIAQTIDKIKWNCLKN